MKSNPDLVFESGASLAGDDTAAEERDWGAAVAGPWLTETLAALRRPDGRLAVDPGPLLSWWGW
jgi:hypothetical protein